MLGMVFRPWLQRPDRPFRPRSLLSSQRDVGAKQVAFLCVVWPIPLGASCAQRPASAFGALALCANNAVAFSLCAKRFTKPEGLWCRTSAEPRRARGCRGAGKLRRLRWFPAPLQRIGGEAADSPNKRYCNIYRLFTRTIEYPSQTCAIIILLYCVRINIQACAANNPSVE